MPDMRKCTRCGTEYPLGTLCPVCYDLSPGHPPTKPRPGDGGPAPESGRGLAG
ncbi:MAG: hypothetical protein U0547_11315 [Dehalococcoidia bacterium]